MWRKHQYKDVQRNNTGCGGSNLWTWFILTGPGCCGSTNSSAVLVLTSTGCCGSTNSTAVLVLTSTGCCGSTTIRHFLGCQTPRAQGPGSGPGSWGTNTRFHAHMCTTWRIRSTWRREQSHVPCPIQPFYWSFSFGPCKVVHMVGH